MHEGKKMKTAVTAENATELIETTDKIGIVN